MLLIDEQGNKHVVVPAKDRDISVVVPWLKAGRSKTNAVSKTVWVEISRGERNGVCSRGTWTGRNERERFTL
jgi:hypothetical protein